MLNFAPTEEQEEIRNLARSLAVEQLRPQAVLLGHAMAGDGFLKSVREGQERERTIAELLSGVVDNRQMMHISVGELFGKVEVEGTDRARIFFGLADVAPDRGSNAHHENAIDKNRGGIFVTGNPSGKTQTAKPAERPEVGFPGRFVRLHD